MATQEICGLTSPVPIVVRLLIIIGTDASVYLFLRFVPRLGTEKDADHDHMLHRALSCEIWSWSVSFWSLTLGTELLVGRRISASGSSPDVPKQPGPLATAGPETSRIAPQGSEATAVDKGATGAGSAGNFHHMCPPGDRGRPQREGRPPGQPLLQEGPLAGILAAHGRCALPVPLRAFVCPWLVGARAQRPPAPRLPLPHSPG